MITTLLSGGYKQTLSGTYTKVAKDGKGRSAFVVNASKVRNSNRLWQFVATIGQMSNKCKLSITVPQESCPKTVYALIQDAHAALQQVTAIEPPDAKNGLTMLGSTMSHCIVMNDKTRQFCIQVPAAFGTMVSISGVFAKDEMRGFWCAYYYWIKERAYDLFDAISVPVFQG